jgi:hypothetical protein
MPSYGYSSLGPQVISRKESIPTSQQGCCPNVTAPRTGGAIWHGAAGNVPLVGMSEPGTPARAALLARGMPTGAKDAPLRITLPPGESE